jgi:hypothetical protein
MIEWTAGGKGCFLFGVWEEDFSRRGKIGIGKMSKAIGGMIF